MPYGNLKAEMGRNNISIEAIAKLLGIHRNSVSNKVNGNSSFTIEESAKIQEVFFPDKELKYLFEKDKPADDPRMPEDRG